MAAEVAIVALIGLWLGLLAGGRVNAPVGPVHADLSVSPSWHGDTVVSVPPLGRLLIDSHDGPLRLDASVTRIDAEEARKIFDNPASVRGLATRVTTDARAAVRALVVRAALAGVAGALLLGLLVFRRRPRRIAAATAAAAVIIVASGGAAVATWNPGSIAQPRYDGLLASAPTLVGDAQDIVGDFQKYERQLAKIVTNVSRLYDVTSTLPSYAPSASTIRVLSVSDIHLNPAAWEIIRSITEQFDVDVIVDTGDISDHGTAAENQFLDPIGTLGVPYVFVRGNHDSLVTQAAVAAHPNATVLDDDGADVAGLHIIGIGDPRFTPDKNTRDRPPPRTVAQTADVLAVLARSAPADLALVHDPAMATSLDGTVPMVLGGHLHRRDQKELPGGTLLFLQGSTGAAGLRGLEQEGPTPVRASVLYFERSTRTLQAWDDITLGGLGLTSAKIERRVYTKPSPAGSGSSSGPGSSSPGSASPGSASPAP